MEWADEDDTSKCRNIGLIYVALAWFVGNGEFVTAGRGHLRTSSLLDANIFQWMDHCFCGHVVFKTLEKR